MPIISKFEKPRPDRRGALRRAVGKGPVRTQGRAAFGEGLPASKEVGLNSNAGTIVFIGV